MFPTGETGQRPVNAAELAGLAERLLRLNPQVVVMEASGGYQTPIAAALGSAGLPVAVVNARQIRDFARAMGILAKTDRLDALVIARFGKAADIEAKPLPSAEARELQELVVRRAQLVEQRAREGMRLQRADADAGARTTEPVVALLSRLIREVDGEVMKTTMKEGSLAGRRIAISLRWGVLRQLCAASGSYAKRLSMKKWRRPRARAYSSSFQKRSS